MPAVGAGCPVGTQAIDHKGALIHNNSIGSLVCPVGQSFGMCAGNAVQFVIASTIAVGCCRESKRRSIPSLVNQKSPRPQCV
jgi:hypothetical protein